MEQKLILSSQIARVNNASNTPSNFTTVFDRPIVLGGIQRYVIGLDEMITMTFLAQRKSRLSELHNFISKW